MLPTSIKRANPCGIDSPQRGQRSNKADMGFSGNRYIRKREKTENPPFFFMSRDAKTAPG
jgi:hypothetical protein